ncbi:hypothetical protein [Sinomonas sp. B1-1]|uniref:hypothetical protein n=1 Tax=Sinomonas sp. B1-1 TaxID=3141454 RepID=UPI003D29A927
MLPSGQSPRQFFLAWLGWVALGEFAGFLIPTAAEALIISLGLEDLPGAALVVVVVAGAGEGAVLGAVQGWRLSRELPNLNRRRFVVLTAAAAMLAWALGMLPVVAAPAWTEWPMAAVLTAAVVLGFALLATIGAGQWLELRRHTARAWLWILATAGAWLVGLGAFFAIAPPLWHEGQPLVVVLAIGALGAAAMAVSMAAVTGWAALRLLRRPTGPRTTA